MYRIAIFLMITFISTAGCFAQLKPKPRVLRKVADQSMVIDDRGSKLEVLPTMRMRAGQLVSSGGGTAVAHRVIQTEQSAPINSQQLGVVFNHAMQAQGYITGEIAFKMKAGLEPTDVLDSVYYSWFAKLTNPGIYIVMAMTPGDFVEFAKRLQGRVDIEWVEPIVTYNLRNPLVYDQ